MVAVRRIAARLRAAAGAWSSDNAGRFAAAMAYYAAFSLAPTIVLLMAIVGFWYGEAAARSHVLAGIADLAGPRVAEAVQTSASAMAHNQSGGWWAALAGTVALFFGASTVFAELKASLNALWAAETKTGRSAAADFIRVRAFGVLLVLLLGAMIIVFVALTTTLATVATFFSARYPWIFALQWVDLFVSFAGSVIFFAVLFKVVPDITLRWRDVLGGATVAAVLFLAGKSVLAWYLSRSATTSAFGVAGSLAAFLLWIYFTTGVFYFGAEYVKIAMRERSPDSRMHCLGPGG